MIMNRAFIALFILFVSVNAVAGMGITYNQTIQYLGDQFTVKQSSPIDGKDRYMGSTADHLAMIEIIGDKHDINQASLMLGLPNDAPEIASRNGIFLVQFLKNTIPEWPSSSTWATNTIQRLVKGGNKVTIVKGQKVITMDFLRPLAMVITTVKEK